MRIHEKIFVAGHSGMLGHAVIEHLKQKRYHNIITKTKEELDLLDKKAVQDFFENEKPEYVILTAATTGATEDIKNNPAKFLYENITIQNNIIHQSYLSKVKKLLFYGCVSMYPKQVPQPMQSDYILSSPMNKITEPLGLAKIAGMHMCLEYNKKYDTKYIVAIPIGLFGKHDNFESENLNLIPSLIRTIKKAKDDKLETLVLDCSEEFWREYLYIDDMADMSVILLRNYPFFEKPINVGTGRIVSTKELAKCIKRNVGFEGEIEFQETIELDAAPIGFNRHQTEELAWYPKFRVEEGLKEVCKFYCENY